MKDIFYTLMRWFLINIEERKCDYLFWEVVGYLCRHVIACINYLRSKLEDYIPYFITKEAYLNTYAVIINPILGQITWDKGQRVKIDPLEKRRKLIGQKK